MSDLEEAMLFQIRALGLPEPVREFAFAPRRRWRFDFCWPSRKLALEVEGITSKDGGLFRHTTPDGYEKDCEKYSHAAIRGWRVMRVTGDMVRDGRAFRLVEQAFNTDDEPPSLTVTVRAAETGGAS